MSWRLCVQLARGSLLLGFFLAMQLTMLIFQLPLCSSKEKFYCDVFPVMRLACADTWVHKPLCGQHDHSHHPLPAHHSLLCLHHGCHPEDPLCRGEAQGLIHLSSRLTVVLLQDGCTSLIFLCPSSSYYPESGQVVSVVYTFITPVLNPLIYSMRNRELKDALKRAMTRVLLL